jgi:spore coat polysaccharide biosynthesis predicted glycosyltransferase SpsG/RimJ/RimL family protein N-acetyltransferase
LVILAISRIIAFIDYGQKEGMGHFFRTLSILDTINNLFSFATLVYTNNPVREEHRNFYGDVEYLFLDNWIGISEISQGELKTSIVIIDSYKIPKIDIDLLIDRSIDNLIIIDDYKDHLNTDGQYLLPSLVKSFNYHNLLEGHKYSLIKKDIIQLRKIIQNLKSYSISNNTVLITLGSYPIESDIKPIVSFILDTTSFDVVILTQTKLDEIKNKRVSLINKISEISNLVQVLRFVICGAGVTANEMVFLGIPQIIVKTAENQNYQFNAFKQLNLLTVDLVTDDFFSELKKSIDSLNDASFYNNYLHKTNTISKLIDGNGPKRVVSKILDLSEFIYLTEAEPLHLDFLFRLRNNEDVRKNSIDSNLISFDNHKNWFHKKLSDDNSFLRIIKFNDKNVGQIRLDIQANLGIISIALIEEFRGLGIANIALKMFLEFITTKRILTSLIAFIKTSNKGSIRLFESCGFKLKTTKEGICEYELPIS